MFILVGSNSLHLAVMGRSCETTSRAIHAGAAFQCGIIIPGSTSGCALLDSRASSRPGLNNSCIRGPPCRHPLAGGSAIEKQWYFKVLQKSGPHGACPPPKSPGHRVPCASWTSIPAKDSLRGGSSYSWPASRAVTLSLGGYERMARSGEAERMFAVYPVNGRPSRPSGPRA